MRHLPTLALLVLAAALITGCGDSTEQKLSKGDAATIKGGAAGDVAVSARGELPKGWPSEVQLPDDTTIVASSAQGGQQVVSAETSASADEVQQSFTKELTGWTNESAAAMGSGDQGRSLVFKRDGKQLLVLIPATKGGSTLKFTVMHGPEIAAG